jgi:hypothetical protein
MKNSDAFKEVLVEMKKEKGGALFIICLFILAAMAIIAIPAEASGPVDVRPPTDCGGEWAEFQRLWNMMQSWGWSPCIETIQGVDRLYVRVRLPEMRTRQGKIIYCETVVIGYSIADVPSLLIEAYYARLGPFPGEEK